jgi:UDP-N-acetylmuramoylalanine--D-glutamate ligase
MLRTKVSVTDFEFAGHLREAFALAIQTASLFRIEKELALEILSKWKVPKGRIELVKKNKNLVFYNDSASIKPSSTLFAVKTLSKQRNLVLIMGGAKGGGSYDLLYRSLPEYVHTVVLLPGSGTIKERHSIEKIVNIKVKSAPMIEEAVRVAVENANKGDIILFSPGFDFGGVDISRKDRGEKFIKAIRICS